MVDLDGTISDDGHRQWLAAAERWEEFHAACRLDPVVEPVALVVRALQCRLAWYRVEVWTGRSERERAVTIEWLHRQDLAVERLRMRPEGQTERDRDVNDIKGEWLAEVGAERVAVVFDDRAPCVAWWRSRGVACFEVAAHRER